MALLYGIALWHCSMALLYSSWSPSLPSSTSACWVLSLRAHWPPLFLSFVFNIFFLNTFFLKIHLSYLYKYIVAVFRHTRRGHQIPLQMVVSHDKSLIKATILFFPKAEFIPEQCKTLRENLPSRGRSSSPMTSPSLQAVICKRIFIDRDTQVSVGVPVNSEDWRT